ncbi:MAG: response regulator transcription factor [Bacteroidetes bacterium]|nr:response regulator transcription factor [Bacteroidota bacterium]
MKLLVIEDEPKVAAFLKQGLEEQGYEVDVAYDGLIGKRYALHNSYDLIILDIIIPYINGVELCKEIRKEKSDIRILMLTALGTTEDKVTGFDSGADDYLVKPFEFRELLARIRSLTRRSSNEKDSINKLSYADLELDLDKKIAHRGGRDIILTAKEFGLLEYFLRNRGKVLSRADIAEKVWDITFDTGTNVVDVYINILRKKIDKDFPDKLIHTRIGMGYIFSKE